MFNVHAIQARYGDCLILEYGTPAKPRYMLVDGGPPKTFDNHLSESLDEIVRTGKLDLTVVSHIDNDHIIGILDLFAALEEDTANGNAFRIDPGDLWHNSFQRAIDPSGEITQRMQLLMTIAGANNIAMPLAADSFYGVKEGNRLRITATKLGIAINKGFTDGLVIPENAPDELKFGRLTLKIVAPSEANLDSLRDEWLIWLAKTEREVGSDPATLANADKSIPNLSSIVMLAECDDKTILLTGDARSDHIFSGLDAGGHLTNGKLYVDVLKLPHHGSDRNVTAKFFKAVAADTYLVSADGTYGNPDEAVLKWIIEAAKADGREITIVATNDTPAITQIQQSHDPDDFGYTMIVKPVSVGSIAVNLA